MRALKQSTCQLWDADKLLHVAFKGVGSLPRAQLDRIRKKQQVIFQAVLSYLLHMPGLPKAHKI